MKRLIFFLVFPILFYSCTKNSDTREIIPIETPEVESPKNIIFLIGDGMGLAQITTAQTVNGGQLNMLTCEYTGIQSTHAADEYVTDSGASGTAMACGQKTNYYTVGVDANGNPIESIIEIAESHGLSTGIVTTSHIAHATPACFYAHNTDRYDYENIAYEIIDKDIDFIMGGGQIYFDQRTDGLNLIDSLLARNYQFANSLNELNGNQKAFVMIANWQPAGYNWGRGDVLPQSVQMAAQQLNENENGFFLMAEGAQIDWAGEDNNESYLLSEMLDFDRACGAALDFAKADGNTLVVITGDHETGGYPLLDGDENANTVQGAFSIDDHTGTMIPVFAFGPGAEAFIGVYENSEIFKKFMDYFDFE